MEEENTSMQVDSVDPPKEATASASGNENFVVIDMAGDSGEDSDKEGRENKVEKQSKASLSDNEAPKTPPPESNTKLTSTKPRMRTKPKAPVVDVNCLRKRKWQLKVYPLHTDDLQLNYHLCKLASESLLYIPSEGRHGKAELYVATQKDTATIIGKLLRMDFYHQLLSIEVVRKDTGGKEDGDDSKKECKAFLMFDKYLSKKIFDAKGEKGTVIEKLVTLTKLPKEATKDFIGALFPFATEVEVFESDNIEERKATVKCKTPVTSLLVYKSFKRLEINDVHVKLSVDDSVKAIQLPPIFFIPPPDKKDLSSFDSAGGLNQSSLMSRRPLLSSSSLNKRAMLIKKKALLTRRGKPPLRSGPLLQRPPRGLMNEEEMMIDHRLGGPPRRPGDGRWPMDMPRMRGSAPRDYPGGPGRRRFNEKRSRDRDSSERGNRRRSQDSQMTKEMLQLQNQLNQAIKNQIAMLNTSQPGGSVRGGVSGERDSFGGSTPSGPQRTSLLGHGPRHFGSSGSSIGNSGSGSRGLMDHDASKGSLLGQGPRHFSGAPGMNNPPRKRDQMEYGGTSWTAERSGRMERDRHERDRGDGRPERMHRNDRMERSVRDRSNDRMERNRERERGERADRSSTGAGDASHQSRSHRLPQSYTADSVRAKGERGHSNNTALSTTSHKSETARGSSRRQAEFPTSNRSSQRNESYSANTNSSNRYGGGTTDYTNPTEGGESSSYYRRY